MRPHITEATNRFINDLRSGKLKRDKLPDDTREEHSMTEKQNSDKFDEFLKSDLFKMIMDM
ncbi:MAG: hypothetical protein KAH01_07720 [Caldisericia bacterium]|nr:hypothetical protein [Caldisericia bacterium]